MAENSWPFENADTTETQFSKWASALADSGIITGLDVTLAGGMSLNVGIGNALVRGMFYENTTAKTLTAAAAPAAGSTRLDAIVLRLDLAANTITAAIKTGTANTSGGVLPSFTQTDTLWEHPLRTITVPGGVASLVTGNIGPITAPVGMRVVPYVGALPTLTGQPRALALALDTMKLSYWSGAAWSDITAAVAWGAITGKPTTFATTDADFTGILPVAKGGTGANSLSGLTVGNASKVGGRQIFVQSGTPTGAVAGDLWFW